ncbi:hypothetical protein [Streptomyces actuosus]|uniref:hypothetical protein n=1 Tax=Streptomyces actuosus TaxID=1885 RepID=UPI00196431E1|nr:hypothetical protein [Streptomyces actuosus]
MGRTNDQVTGLDGSPVGGLSFGELLGLLTYSPALLLLGDEVDDPAALRAAARTALATAAAWELEAWASMALDVHSGRVPGNVLCSFVARLGAAITRTFGVTA